jgi:hypothetical protein
MTDRNEPRNDERFTLRLVEEETGDIREVELTAAQALDFCAGKAISSAVDGDPFITEDGQLGVRESAVPRYRDNQEEDLDDGA